MAASKKKKIVIGSIILVGVVAGAGVFANNRNGKTEVKLGVRTGKAEIGVVQVKVTEVGTVEPEVKVDVKSPVSGKVVDLFVREGDHVQRGQLMANVEPDLNQAQSLAETKNELLAAQISYDQARQNFSDDDQLMNEGLLATKDHRDTESAFRSAKQRYDSALEKYKIVEQNGIPISRTSSSISGSRITAPMDGIVLTKSVEIGESVTSGVSSFNAGTVIFSVADVSTMIIKAGVNEVDIGKLRLGQQVKVTLDAYAKTSFQGRIDRIAPAVRLDDKVRVFDVEIRLDTQGRELRSGMTANIEVIGERKENVLTIPVEGLFKRDEGEVVYIRKAAPKEGEKKAEAKKSKDGKPDPDAWMQNFERRTVVSGLADNSRAEILEGMKEGEEIALEDPTLPLDKRDDDDD